MVAFHDARYGSLAIRLVRPSHLYLGAIRRGWARMLLVDGASLSAGQAWSARLDSVGAA